MPYECEECSKKFAVRQTLIRHLHSHTEDKTLKVIILNSILFKAFIKLLVNI